MATGRYTVFKRMPSNMSIDHVLLVGQTPSVVLLALLLMVTQ